MCLAECVNTPDGRQVGLGGNIPEKKFNRSKDELRELWRTAIKQQILLQRMEKENLKLKGEKMRAGGEKHNWAYMTAWVKVFLIRTQLILLALKQARVCVRVSVPMCTCALILVEVYFISGKCTISVLTQLACMDTNPDMRHT